MKLAPSPADNALDPTVRYTKLELNGRVYKLAFDFNAIATAEEYGRVNLLDALEFRNLNASQYRGLLYAALLKAQPKTTLVDAGKLVTMRDMPQITDALILTWKASMRPEEEEENPPQPAPGAAHIDG